MREHVSVTVCVCFYLCFLQVSADVTEAEANYQTPNGWYLVHYAAYLGVSLPVLYIVPHLVVWEWVCLFPVMARLIWVLLLHTCGAHLFMRRYVCTHVHEVKSSF